jgi:hypothetical protein
MFERGVAATGIQHRMADTDLGALIAYLGKHLTKAELEHNVVYEIYVQGLGSSQKL